MLLNKPTKSNQIKPNQIAMSLIRNLLAQLVGAASLKRGKNPPPRRVS